MTAPRPGPCLRAARLAPRIVGDHVNRPITKPSTPVVYWAMTGVSECILTKAEDRPVTIGSAKPLPWKILWRSS
jgi:hypothetical protein